MQLNKKPSLVPSKVKTPPILAEAGMALIDVSFNVFASDHGARTILKYATSSAGKPYTASALPDEVLEILRKGELSEETPVKVHLHVGKVGYICRAYSLGSMDGSPKEPWIVLHLERDLPADNAIRDIVGKYHLTEREEEVIRGISIGLATKELAEWMNISPNTVKAFIRLVMIKMGVTTRAGIVAKLLHNGAADGQSPLPYHPPRGWSRSATSSQP